MALIALKWDKDFIRVVVGTNARGTRLKFDRAIAVELVGDIEELSPVKLGDKLKVILEKVGVQRGDATVIVARRDVEMRQFQLPPVPTDELPDMVRFQARNHFTSFNEEFLVDFVPLSTTEEHSTVLAAALSGDEVQKIRDTVEAAGLKLRHIVVRPFAAAELIRVAHQDSRCRVVLEMIGQEADISIVDNGYVVMSRTVRVPENYTVEQFDTWIPGEIRRTITAARGQAGASEIKEIVVCGNSKDRSKLAEELREKFDIETSFLPPFDLIQTSSRFERPAHDDGFASLLGSLLQSTGEGNHALDFLNPRKKPERKLDKRKVALGAGLAACVCLLGLLVVFMLLSRKDRQIAELKTKIEKVRISNKFTNPILRNTRPLDRWYGRKKDWLEELYRISELMPEPEQTRVTKFVGDEESKQKGTMTLHGVIEGGAGVLRSRLENDNYSFDIKSFDTPYNIELLFPETRVGPNGELIRPGDLNANVNNETAKKNEAE